MTCASSPQSRAFQQVGFQPQTDKADSLHVLNQDEDFRINRLFPRTRSDSFTSPDAITSSTIELIKRVKTLSLPKSHWANPATS